MPTLRPLRSPCALLAGSLGALCLGAPALAQTWDGGGADNNWTTIANWNPDGLPVNNGTATITFAGSARLLPVVNSPQDVFSLTFNNTAGAFRIQGPSILTIRAGGITSNTAVSPMVILAPVTVAAAQTWNLAAGGLDINGALTLNANLIVSGSNLWEIFGPTSGAGAITRNGNLNLGAGAALNHTGGTTINSGTLALLVGNVLPDTGTLTLAGTGQLHMNGQTDTLGTLSSGSPTATVFLPTTSFLTVGTAPDSTFAGALSGDPSALLIKTGTGILTLSGVSTYPGSVQVIAGTLTLPASQRLDAACTLLVSGNGTLSLPTPGTLQTVNQLFVVNGGTVAVSDATISPTIGCFLGQGLLGTHISGAGSLNKNNAGTMTLQNSNSYTGGTSVAVDTLVSVANGAIPDTGNLTVNATCTFQMSSGVTDTIAGLFGSGNVALVAAPTILSIGSGNAGGNFSGVISGQGSIAKVGTGTLTLSGPNTYTGTTTVNAGFLQTFNNERVADASDLVVNTGGTFSISSFNETLDGVVLAGGTIFGSPVSPGTITANVLDLRSGSVSARLAGPATLVKTTAGTLTLTAPNIHTGGTELADGTLTITSDLNLGAPGAPLDFIAGTLQVLSSTTINRPVFLVSNTTFATQGDVTLVDVTANSANLNKTGTGALILQASLPALSGLSVNAGSVQIPDHILVSSQGVALNGTSLLEIDGGILNANSISIGATSELRLSGDARCNSLIGSAGTISGSGQLTGSVTNNASGSIRVTPGASLHFAGASSQTNAGLIEVIDAQLEFDGPVTNSSSTGLIFARDASLHFDAGLTNFGSLGISFGVTDVFGDIDNRAAASIVVSGLADVTFVDDVSNNGTIRTSAGAASVFFGGLSGAGSFPGTGIVFMEGDLRPGNSPAIVDFEGSLVFGSSAALEIELGGPASGAFDQVTVGGDAVLDGTLDVRLINNFHPTGVVTFPIIVAGNREQQFSQVNLPADARGLVVQYTPTEVRLRFCAADFNSDGVGNSQDFFNFLNAFFASDPIADFNRDATINSQDFFDFLTAFFAGCP